MKLEMPIYARWLLLCGCLGSPRPTSAQSAQASIQNSLDLSRMTALYLDCAEVTTGNDKVDLGLLSSRWNASLNYAKQFLSSDEGKRIKWAISLEESIDYNATHTHATIEQVSALIASAKLFITRTDSAPHSFINGPPVIEITTGLIRRVCKSLVPPGDFAKLLAEAMASEQKEYSPQEQEIQKKLIADASKLAASFLLHDITYAGLRIFTVGHELSHATLDRFSTDLTDGSVYTGGQECANAFFTETRADLIGQVAVENTPLDGMLGDSFASHLREFGREELANMTEAATVLSSDDQLMVVVNTKEWESDACLSPEQRRQVLHDSILRRRRQAQH
jgi:hypothetical protein